MLRFPKLRRPLDEIEAEVLMTFLQDQAARFGSV
jgi:hypothetical protein